MAELEFFSPEWAAAVRDALTAGPPEPVRAGKLQEYWDLFDFIKSVYPASWALGCRELPADLGGGPAYLIITAVIGRPLSNWLALVAIVAFIAGFVTLVVRMGDRPRDDDDDGAVV